MQYNHDQPEFLVIWLSLIEGQNVIDMFQKNLSYQKN